MPSSTARRPTLAGVGELPVLDPVQQRVLGCLLEKQVTVPAGYPLTLNALRSACNQVTSRDPVMDLDERAVTGAARALRDLGLVRVVWSESGRRTVKYEQTLDQVLGLAADERAVLTVLLLRGAQAPGELRTHGDRLHPFADREQVQGCLRQLADRVDPLVCQLERRAGQQDNRWVHLLGPTAEPATAAAAAGEPAMDLELPIADGVQARDARVRATYGRLAATYADRFDTELDGLPFERWLLDRVVAEVGGRPVIDAGCGPGHVTAYLAQAGARARGIDLSPEMIDQARARFPAVDYQVGDLTGLMRPEDADAWGGVLGWYSLIHLAGSELPGAVAALARPLAPDGVLVLALHAGTGVRRVRSWLGLDVEIDVVLHEPGEVVTALAGAGLSDIEWFRRGPLTTPAESTERLYLLARRPTS
jgi:uncharacterized protein YceH (UPF0502 family)